MKNKKFLKNRNGAAVLWMLIAFTVLTILMSSIVYISRQDILETKKQEERLQTYYIALAGAEMTYAGLMDEGNGLDKKQIDKVIEKYKDKSINITEDLDIKIDGQIKGTAKVTIDKVEKDNINWIRIKSIGQLRDKGTKVSTVIRINQDRTNQIVREKFIN